MTRTRQAIGAVGVIALLAGCGSDFAEESASSIEKASIKDMKALESVHIEGAVTQQETELGRDVTLTADGDCVGSVSISGGENSGSAELISVDGTSYVKPDEAFWEAQAGPQAERIISTVGSDWVQLPEGDESFTAVCDFDELIDQIEDDQDKSWKKGETKEVDGTDAVKLSRDAEQGGGTVTVWVAVDDPHHIVKLEQEGDDASSSFTFSKFDENAAIEAPADDEVTTVEELQQQTRP